MQLSEDQSVPELTEEQNQIERANTKLLSGLTVKRIVNEKASFQ